MVASRFLAWATRFGRPETTLSAAFATPLGRLRTIPPSEREARHVSRRTPFGQDVAVLRVVIREMMRLRRREKLESLANDAINQTLSRTIIASGLTGFFTQFFYGLIIILSLISHRFNQGRYRY